LLHGLSRETFSGVTVVDLTRLLPGPFCTMLLADLGARVIKVEAVEGGDYARWYPPIVEESAGGFGAFFQAVNRGKLSVAVDLKAQEGLAFVRRLISTADVVVESFRPGVLERLGLSEDVLRDVNPQLVLCRISGFGQTGPLAKRAGHDLNYLARAGVLSLTGPSDGAPVMPAVQVADIAGGALYAAFGIASALYRRARTSSGTVLDISMTEGVLSMLGPMMGMTFRMNGAPRRGGEMLTGGMPCYRTYETSDGRFMALAALEPKFWFAFCELVGRSDLATDGLQMGEEGARVAAEVAAVFRSRTFAEWISIFAEADVCCEPVLSLEEVLVDAHTRARSALAGTYTPVPPTTPRDGSTGGRAPRLGEHTRAVAEGLGYEFSDVERLAASGVLGVCSDA